MTNVDEVVGGANFVGRNYSWLASGYFWSVYCNDDKGKDMNDISSKDNGSTSSYSVIVSKNDEKQNMTLNNKLVEITKVINGNIMPSGSIILNTHIEKRQSYFNKCKEVIIG